MTSAFSPGDPPRGSPAEAQVQVQLDGGPPKAGQPTAFLVSQRSWHCEQRDLRLWISDGKHWPTGLVNNRLWNLLFTEFKWKNILSHLNIQLDEALTQSQIENLGPSSH